MYSILELKRPAGRTAAIIESFDQRRLLTFVESETLQKGLERILCNGLDVVIPRGSEQIVINTLPTDSDFLEKIGRYLQLSFDFLFYYTKTEIPPKTTYYFETKPTILLDNVTAHIFSWPNKKPRVAEQIKTHMVSTVISINNSPNWVIYE